LSAVALLRRDLPEENSIVISGDELITTSPKSAFRVQFTCRFRCLSFPASLQDFNPFTVSFFNLINSLYYFIEIWCSRFVATFGKTSYIGFAKTIIKSILMYVLRYIYIVY